jgi:hypothetical protein
MRVAVPNWEVPIQINQTGIGIINLFTSDLFNFIDSNLANLLGRDWVTTMPREVGGTASLNFRDPSVLLKDLGRKITPSLRLPINAKVAQDKHVQFYNLLDEIHGERHLWVHQEIEPTKKNLFALVDLIKITAAYLDLVVSEECKELVKEDTLVLNNDEPKVVMNSSAEPALVSELNTLTKDEALNVGTPLKGPYLDHSYTLHLNGSIRDRDSGILLSEVNANAEAVGTLLIARKPNGGRIRLVSNGVLAAYFDDHWGFLAQVEEDNWFPEHLMSSTNP